VGAAWLEAIGCHLLEPLIEELHHAERAEAF
jgi:hypothetical protein